MSHSIEIKDVLGTYEVAIASSEKPRKKLVITSMLSSNSDNIISFFTVYVDSQKKLSSKDIVTAVATYNSI
tara:strand:- start:86 stop:298 length:213 start_codon:yes stop_codon:yes gene_type:complete